LLKRKEKRNEMYKKILSLAMLAMVFLGLFAIPKAFAVATCTFSVYATKTTGLDLDDIFTVTIQIRDFHDIWMWQTGLMWTAGKLECQAATLVFSKTGYAQSIFAILASLRNTIPAVGTVDNIAGKIFPPYAESLTSPGTGVNGTPSTKYNLLKVDFKVTGYFPSGMNLTPIGTKWTAYPAVGTGVAHNIEPLTIYSVTPPGPYGPKADFMWAPIFPKQGENITFNAGASKSGFNGSSMCPIQQYRWDWNNDGAFETNVSGAVTIHTFMTAGDYPVKLEVYAPGASPDTNSTTKTVRVVPPSKGAYIDLYCNKVPYDGKTNNTQSDAFAPQELVILHAKVTYNEDPVANKIVGFQVNSSDGQAIMYRTNMTDDSGIATVEFRIPSDPPFGLWLAWAVVDVAGTTVYDTMPFEVGWIVEILSVVPGGLSYKKGETANFTMTIKNISFMSKTVVLTMVIYDDCAVPIFVDKIVPYVIAELTTIDIMVWGDIPLWAFKGTGAKIYVNSFTDLPSNNGVPTCPEASASFQIESP
jgi:PKD repeat protein